MKRSWTIIALLPLLAGCPAGGSSSNATADGDTAEFTTATVTTDPPDGSRTLESLGSIRVTFSRAMDPGTLREQTIILARGIFKPDGDPEFNITPVTVVSDPAGATVTPLEPLDGDQRYSMRIYSEVRDAEGRRLPGNLEFAFFTLDSLAPSLVESFPTDGAKGYDSSQPIVFTLDDEVRVEAVQPDWVMVEDSFGGNVPGEVTASGNQVRFLSESELPTDAPYTATLSASVQDESGNELGAPVTIRFETIDTIAPEFLFASPGQGDTDVPANLNQIDVFFNEPLFAARREHFDIFRVSSGSSVEFNATNDPGNDAAKLQPTEFFFPRADYEVQVHTSLTDVAGNPLAQEEAFTFTSEPWGIPHLGEESDLPAIEPQVLVAEDGRIWQFWQELEPESELQAVWYRYFDIATNDWGMPAALVTDLSADIDHPRVLLDESRNKVWVFWIQEDQNAEDQVWWSTGDIQPDGTINFGPGDRVSTLRQPVLSPPFPILTSANEVAVGWQKIRNNQTFLRPVYREWNSSTDRWATNKLLGNNKSDTSHYGIDWMGITGWRYISWLEQDPGAGEVGPRVNLWSSHNSSNWIKLKISPDVAGTVHLSQTVVHDGGSDFVFLVWQNNDDIWAVVVPDGDNPGTAIKLNTTNPQGRTPFVGNNGSGQAGVYAVWHDESGGVYQSNYDPVGPSWSTPELISNPGVPVQGLQMAFPAAGSPLTLWEENGSLIGHYEGSLQTVSRNIPGGDYTKAVPFFHPGPPDWQAAITFESGLSGDIFTVLFRPE